MAGEAPKGGALSGRVEVNETYCGGMPAKKQPLVAWNVRGACRVIVSGKTSSARSVKSCMKKRT
jgi:hypothetical protein